MIPPNPTFPIQSQNYADSQHQQFSVQQQFQLLVQQMQWQQIQAQQQQNYLMTMMGAIQKQARKNQKKTSRLNVNKQHLKVCIAWYVSMHQTQSLYDFIMI